MTSTMLGKMDMETMRLRLEEIVAIPDNAKITGKDYKAVLRRLVELEYIQSDLVDKMSRIVTRGVL